MSHDGGEIWSLFNGMARQLQRFEKRGGKAGFEFQGCGVAPPCPPEEPSRRGNGGLKIVTMLHVARKDRCLRLWLAVAAHRTIHHKAAILKTCKRGIERMERFPARHQSIWDRRIERKACASVLPVDACFWQDDTRAELPIGAF